MKSNRNEVDVLQRILLMPVTTNGVSLPLQWQSTTRKVGHSHKLLFNFITVNNQWGYLNSHLILLLENDVATFWHTPNMAGNETWDPLFPELIIFQNGLTNKGLLELVSIQKYSTNTDRFFDYQVSACCSIGRARHRGGYWGRWGGQRVAVGAWVVEGEAC